MRPVVGLLGLGSAVPPHVHPAGDPATNRPPASEREALFSGHHERRCLAPGESLGALMALAGERALADAGCSAPAIDRLYGYESIAEYLTPNGLFDVHQRLGLARGCMVVPINNDFGNFITGVILAWEAILAGNSRLALVNCGTCWTRHVDPAEVYASVTSDGAGAAVVGEGKGFTVLDYAVETISEEYDVMTMKCRTKSRGGARYTLVDAHGLPTPVYDISEAGIRTAMTHGIEVPPRLALGLLAKHGLRPDQVALVTHQTRTLMDLWAEAIQPKEYLDTYAIYGNLSHATLPVTLAHTRDTITAEYVLMIATGTGTHFSTLLLKR